MIARANTCVEKRASIRRAAEIDRERFTLNGAGELGRLARAAPRPAS